MIILLFGTVIIIVALLIYLKFFRWSVSVPDYMAARHYRFGKPSTSKPISGRSILVIPSIDQLVMIDKRIQKSTLENISVLTKERQSIKISVTLIWKPIDASMTIESIRPEDIEPTFFKIIESVIKNESSKMTVDEMLENRTVLSKNLIEILCETTDKWGIQVSSVNISSLVVMNESFMRNMSMPKEIEVERKAKLAQIEKDLAIDLKLIQNNTDAELSKLRAEEIIGVEKEKIYTVLERSKKERELLIQEMEINIEKINSEILLIKEKSITDAEAERIQSSIIAEANGLKEKLKVINSYSTNAMNYETVKILPELYNNIKMGDITLLQNSSENKGFDFYSYIASSALSFLKKSESEEKGDSSEIIDIDKIKDIND
ncbi:MAG: SPFH domain-containing protein [Solirubrobacterales bacterium]